MKRIIDNLLHPPESTWQRLENVKASTPGLNMIKYVWVCHDWNLHVHIISCMHTCSLSWHMFLRAYRRTHMFATLQRRRMKTFKSCNGKDTYHTHKATREMDAGTESKTVVQPCIQGRGRYEAWNVTRETRHDSDEMQSIMIKWVSSRIVPLQMSIKFGRPKTCIMTTFRYNIVVVVQVIIRKKSVTAWRLYLSVSRIWSIWLKYRCRADSEQWQTVTLQWSRSVFLKHA